MLERLLHSRTVGAVGRPDHSKPGQAATDRQDSMKELEGQVSFLGGDQWGPHPAPH